MSIVMNTRRAICTCPYQQQPPQQQPPQQPPQQQAHVDVLNPNGETPLHWACSLGHVNATRCLVGHGADTMLHERVQVKH